MNKNKPALTLNTNDKIYLAVASELGDKLSYVYALVCLKNQRMQNYNNVAVHETYVFKNRNAAEMYSDALLCLVALCENTQEHKLHFGLNKAKIEDFNNYFNPQEHIR
jgi:hypothetical protein